MSTRQVYRNFDEIPLHLRESLRTRINALIALERKGLCQKESLHRQLMEGTLNLIPSISESSAAALIRKFKTMEKIANAGLEELKEPINMGPVKGRIVQDLMVFCRGCSTPNDGDSDVPIL